MIDPRVRLKMFESDLKRGDPAAVRMFQTAVIDGIKQGVDTAMREAGGRGLFVHGDSETDDGEGGQNSDDYFGLLLWGE